MTGNGNRDGGGVARIGISARTVTDALAHARAFCAALGCDGDMEARVAIIVEELVFNIVEHGDPPDDDWIDLALADREDGVGIVLTDGGTHFDLRDAAPPEEVPPERGGGAGIALVLTWSRVEDYARVEGRNRLALFIPA